MMFTIQIQIILSSCLFITSAFPIFIYCMLNIWWIIQLRWQVRRHSENYTELLINEHKNFSREMLLNRIKYVFDLKFRKFKF